MIERRSVFTPDWVSAPGETLADLLEDRGWTQVEFAKRSGFSSKHVNKLVSGEAPIGEGTALRLEKVTGAPAHFWLRREADYREAMARRADMAQLEAQKDWLKELPINEMIKYGWIQKQSTAWEQVTECLSFFGVASREAWKEQYDHVGVAFRASPKFELKRAATVSWLRRGELAAQSIDCAPYSRERFLEVLREIRALTRIGDPKVFCPELIKACASCGVAVVFEPAPKGCPASGATKWLSPHKALLMLSLRHGTDDHLWFSFFHEAGHIVLHKRSALFLELKNEKNHIEEEANKFARGKLIPDEYLEAVLATSHTYAAIKEIANQLGVSDGIIVGRLQYEEVLPWGMLNKCKVRFMWQHE